jgi:hypothetical protein
MKYRCTLAAAVALAFPATAAAQDAVVAKVPRGTPLAADHGYLLYNVWDGTSYRLTLRHAGSTSTLPIPGSPQPLTPDLGPALDGEVAVYSRCDHGCDLYRYDLATGRERKLTAADDPHNDELAGAVWRDALVFTRRYKHTSYIYKRPLSGGGSSVRIAHHDANQVDVRGNRVPFTLSLEWSNEPWLGSLDGVSHRIRQVPGSGAAVDFLTAVDPTAYGRDVWWMYTSSGDHDWTELHRYDGRRDVRVGARMAGAASGFAFDAGTIYYAAPDDPVCTYQCPTTIYTRRAPM